MPLFGASAGCAVAQVGILRNEKPHSASAIPSAALRTFKKAQIAANLARASLDANAAGKVTHFYLAILSRGLHCRNKADRSSVASLSVSPGVEVRGEAM